MRKSVILFWSLFFGIMVFTFGVQFAYSQFSNQFPSTPPSSGAYHTSDQVVCDNCISSGNIANNAVGTGEIIDGTIADGDVSVGAGIFTRKINGANGWHFNTGTIPSSAPTSPVFTPLTTVGNMGMTNWAGAYVEIICDPSTYVSGGSASGSLIVSGGQNPLGNIYRRNHHIVLLNPGQGHTVYYSTDGVRSQTLLMSTTGGTLSFARSYVSSPSSSAWTTNEPEINNYECILRVLSLCSGGPGTGASCSN